MKKMLLIGLGTIAMGLGAFAGLSANSSAKEVGADWTGTVDVYVQLSGWSHTYVYMYDEITDGGGANTIKSLGAWPGTEVSLATTATDFNHNLGGLGGIGKITVPYKNLANTKIMLNNNEGAESGKADLHDGYFYWNNGSEGNADYGAQAKVVYDIEAAVRGATNASVCQVAKGTAISLLEAYDALGGKTCVDSSTYYTWSGTETGGGAAKSDISYDKLIAQLRVIANAPSGGASVVASFGESANDGAVIITAAAIASTMAIGTVLAIRKRKEDR